MNPLEIPELTSYVNDFSGVLSPTERDSFVKQLEEHEAKTSEQVVVVLIPHREGHELLDIGLKIFNENGIGQKNLNNGLLLIIATEEKKIRIITGKGMEIKYSEMDCRDIIENHLRPLLNDGKYMKVVQNFIKNISGNQDDQIGANNTRSFYKKIEPIKLIAGIIILSILGNGLFYGFLFIYDVLDIISVEGIIADGSTLEIITGGYALFAFIMIKILLSMIEKTELDRVKIVYRFINSIFVISGLGSIIFLILSLTQFPSNCHEKIVDTKTNLIEIHCERNIGMKKYIHKSFELYQSNELSNPISPSSSSSRSYESRSSNSPSRSYESRSSNSSSSHSSFGGGGGTSNGGGYGD